MESASNFPHSVRAASRREFDKRRCFLFLFLIPFLLLSACQAREHGRPVPERHGFVNDYAGVFSNEEAAGLEADLQAYERETCHQILVLTVRSLQGETIAAFSSRTAEAWEIGQPTLQNGVLITVAMDEHKARIEAGRGLDFLVKEGKGEEILNQIMVPFFREGKMAEGIKKGVEALMAAARSKTYPENRRPLICLP